MRRFAVLGSVAALGLLVAGIGTSAPSQLGLTGACARSNLDLVNAGKLSLATDNLSFPPWWGGTEGQGFSPSNPYSGEGYESAVSYELAKRLGFSKAEVTWSGVPFAKSFAPGKKAFDWYISEVSYSPERAKVVDFSNSYYYVNQAVVALKGTKISKVKTVAGLKPYTLGAPVGTTSYNYIVRYIKPAPKPKVYDSVLDTIRALKNKQIDGLVIDFPSTGYLTGVQLPSAKVVGRLPNRGVRERFGMVFEKGSSLDSCVNRALATMWADGTIKRLESKWLARAGGAPILK
jgi:polar amino acid transport system substrate-binding protein